MRFEHHVVEKRAPNFCYLSLGLPCSLLAYFSVFIVKVEPVPLVVLFRVSAKFIKLDLLLVMATLKESGELFLAATKSPHCVLLTALFERGASFPALSSCYFICFHFQSILFDTSEDVEPPVVPHRWACLNNVVGLWMQPRQISDGTVLLFGRTVVSQVLLLLSKHRRGQRFLALQFL